jgi:hypothetical protein
MCDRVTDAPVEIGEQGTFLLRLACSDHPRCTRVTVVAGCAERLLSESTVRDPSEDDSWSLTPRAVWPAIQMLVLEGVPEELAQEIRSAEATYWSDPLMVLVRVRRFVEHLLEQRSRRDDRAALLEQYVAGLSPDVVRRSQSLIRQLREVAGAAAHPDSGMAQPSGTYFRHAFEALRAVEALIHDRFIWPDITGGLTR